jgi:thiamine biosynthesis protein ThiS
MLVSALRVALAMKIVVNGEAREIQGGTTVARLVELIGSRVGAVAVEVNREVVPRAEHETRVLREGDKVEVVHFVGGG